VTRSGRSSYFKQHEYDFAGSLGHGLMLMAERVASIGGDLHITSPVGMGTTISANLPRRL
jgi:signal transduction histidine kinase